MLMITSSNPIHYNYEDIARIYNREKRNIAKILQERTQAGGCSEDSEWASYDSERK